MIIRNKYFVESGLADVSVLIAQGADTLIAREPSNELLDHKKQIPEY